MSQYDISLSLSLSFFSLRYYYYIITTPFILIRESSPREIHHDD